MRVLKNPVAQFLAAGVVIVIAVTLVSDVLSRRAAEREAVADARAFTEVLGKGVVEGAMTLGLSEGSHASADRLNDVLGEKGLLESVERIKIWNAEGDIVYSDDPSVGTSS